VSGHSGRDFCHLTALTRHTVATDGSWFLHRLLHLPTATGDGLSDVVDTSQEAVELARGVNVSTHRNCVS
jgi:hypothetical protein